MHVKSGGQGLQRAGREDGQELAGGAQPLGGGGCPIGNGRQLGQLRSREEGKTKLTRQHVI